MSAVLFIVGVALVIGGTAVIHWPAAVVVAGVICIAASLDLRPTASETQ